MRAVGGWLWGEDGGGGAVGPEENLAAWMEKKQKKKTLPAEQALTQRLLGKKEKKSVEWDCRAARSRNTQLRSTSRTLATGQFEAPSYTDWK